MYNERKYRDDEIAELFEAAAAAVRRDPGAGALAPAEGMTLAELQAIGGEVGLPPERIAEAAAALDLRRDAVRRSDFGMPVSVGRTVDLPRPPTDHEWEVLVADLRQTFQTRGRVGAREWNKGNLHAYVEPTATGARLRLGTTMGNAVPLNRMGALSLVMAVLSSARLLAGGELPDAIMPTLIFTFVGGAALAMNAMRLTPWARRREEQMERVAARARALLGGQPAERAAGEAG